MVLHDDDDGGVDGASKRRVAAVMSELGTVDVERTDPPPRLWDRIAASVASESPAGARTSGTVVEYTIDGDDIVATVAGDWAEFARDNHAPELEAPVADRTLWSYFEGDEVRDLWRVLVERARATDSPATVPLRCDAPGTRRWFEMTITPEPDHRVHFRSVLLFEEARPDLALLDRLSERESGATSVSLCSWCDRGHDGSRWVPIDQLVHDHRLLEETPVPPVSHGICPQCREEMSAESERLLAGRQR